MRTDDERTSNRRNSGRLDPHASDRIRSRRLSDSEYSYSKHSASHARAGRSPRSSLEKCGSGSDTSYRDHRSYNSGSRFDGDLTFLETKQRHEPTSSKALSVASHAWENFRIPVIILLAAIILSVVLLFMFAFNSGRYVKGTTIGQLDVSGMTVSEATDALNQYYVPKIEASQVYVFADEKTRDSKDLDLQLIEADAQAEQGSFEEAKANKKLWVAKAENVGASLPSEEIALAAKELSDATGFLDRAGITSTNVNTPVKLAFDDGFLDDFLEDLNDTLGSPVRDYSLEIHDGIVYVNKGKSGKLIDKEEFKDSLTELMLSSEAPISSYVASLSKATYDIGSKKANKTKKAIEKLVPESVELKSGNASMKVSKPVLMSWISIDKEQVGDSWALRPHFTGSLAASSVTASLNKAKDGKFTSVHIDKSKDGIKVSTDEKLDLYDLDSALAELEDRLFGTFNAEGRIDETPKDVTIDLSITSSSDQFSLEEALSNGIVEEFSSYTTKYANTTSTANRTNNIHIAAKKLNNSIAKANGGTWSFNNVAGAADAENGYLEANVIDGNTMTTGVGGGICQVATTVFNSVYEAGLPIPERHNHSLYTSSYPAGRDAAIAYPYLDLKWVNDTDSDILVTTSFTDYSVTVKLIGVDPERSVKTDTGEWEKGAKYKTLYEVDKKLSKDASYVKQNGSNGMNISVTRTTYGKDGSVINTNSFPSSYAATDRVIAYGKKSDMDALKEKYEKKSKKKKQEKAQDEADSPEKTEEA